MTAFFKSRRNLIFLLSLFFAFTGSAVIAWGSNHEKPFLPPSLINKIQWEIQKEMSFTAQGEKSLLLWTPRIIKLQSHEAYASPLLNPLSPNEINYSLTYDVGMGHNMSSTPIYWRQCDVQINSTDGVWGEPSLDCDLRK